MDADRLRCIVLAARPQGPPKLEDFRLEEHPIPSAADGGVLLRVRYISLDPYMRGRMDDRKSYVPAVALGAVMPAESIAEVIVAHHPDYAKGDLVVARTGWCSHAALPAAGLRKLTNTSVPVTTALGVLGMPGFTAYAGMRVIGQPKAGETVVVAAATGPVGSLVGQLARAAGARAVGIAGGAEKCTYALREFGFDAALDHREPNLPERLAAVCPQGIDVYFENVGGAIWQAVLPLLNKFARVPVCGLIAQYNSVEPEGGRNALAATMRAILTRSLTVRGFINYDFAEHYPDFLREVGAGVAAGRIRYREDIVEGLARAPQAFIGMLTGRNFGKLLVRVTPDA